MMGKLYSDDIYSRIRDNLSRIRETMAAACAQAGRPDDAVTLMGVTKTVDNARIQAALDAGVRHMGENRVQEYLGKKDGLNLAGVTTHLIGHLQTNKVSRIVGEVDMIQAVDSLRLAQAIEKASAARERVTDVLVEVNIGREDAKSGVMQEELEQLLEEISVLGHLKVQGLMTVPPHFETESDKRKVFMNMHKLFIDMKGKKIDNINMHILSMGMSGDYREAILEGSTMVRIGSALFGERIY